MKLLKCSWKICLVAVASFVLGAWLFHTPTTKAAPTGTVYIKQTKVSGAYAFNGTSVQGSTIVGFSCLADSDGNAMCYIASM